ncbi:hypothetical protein HOA92_06245 [archaeon]|jgi:hypothetical protein|nr:hypothetical protein [archaeon]MBT6762611.1 hypothetical protein [archaeon]
MGDLTGRQESIIYELAGISNLFTNVELSFAVDIFSRRWGARNFGVIHTNLASYARANDETVSDLEVLGLAGEHAHYLSNPKMKLRDYLSLVPKDALPSNYIY